MRKSLFPTEIAFWQAFARMNALYAAGGYCWEEPHARKEHVDEFGVKVMPGESYFRLKTGSSGLAYRLLSRQSMEMVVYLVAYVSPAAEMRLEEIRRASGMPLPVEAP